MYRIIITVKTNKINIPPHIRKRSTYLDKIKPFMGKPIIKVLTGQRRVGKSYLLYQLIQLVLEQDQNAAILYINKEDLAFSSLKSASDLAAITNAERVVYDVKGVLKSELVDGKL